MVIFVSVSCSTFFKFRPSLPIRRPTKLLWAKIFRGTSSALERRMEKENNVKDYCSQKRRYLVQRDGGTSSPLTQESPGLPSQSSCTRGGITQLLGTVPEPGKEPQMGHLRTARQKETLRLGILRLLLHDLQNHLAGGGAALGGGVDADGFFCSSRVFFPVHVDPASTGWALGPGSGSAASPLPRSPHVPTDRLELTLERKVICTQGEGRELILGSVLHVDMAASGSNHRNPNKASASIYFKPQE